MGLRTELFNFFARCLQRVFLYMGDPANEIVPGLWLGNRKAALDEEWLRREGISVVFNATKDIPFAPGYRTLYRVPVDDNLEEEEIRNMELWAWEIVFKLLREYNSGKRILVHCYAGMQRSAAIIAMFLIAKYRCTTDEAIKFIKKRRPIAFHVSANFYKSIKSFEQSLYKMISANNSYQQFPRVPLPTY